MKKLDVLHKKFSEKRIAQNFCRAEPLWRQLVKNTKKRNNPHCRQFAENYFKTKT